MDILKNQIVIVKLFTKFKRLKKILVLVSLSSKQWIWAHWHITYPESNYISLEKEQIFVYLYIAYLFISYFLSVTYVSCFSIAYPSLENVYLLLLTYWKCIIHVALLSAIKIFKRRAYSPRKLRVLHTYTQPVAAGKEKKTLHLRYNELINLSLPQPAWPGVGAPFRPRSSY